MNKDTKENKVEEPEVVTEIEIVDPLNDTEVITDIIFDGKTDVTIMDIQYMCDYINKYIGCEYCPLNNGKSCGYAIMLRKFKTGKEINKTILNWLRENPPTSYLMDIKEKMPTVVLDDKFNIPNFCVHSIYGKDCCKCAISDPSKFDTSDMLCRKCWRTPMDD